MTPINEVVFIVCRIDAYKHIKVRDIDIPLQCISFLGKIFTEGSVTFGASSSLSIFHWISEIILVLSYIRCQQFTVHLPLDFRNHLGSGRHHINDQEETDSKAAR